MSEFPEWVIDGLTDIKMSARDRAMSDQEFFNLVTSFVAEVTKSDAEDE